MSYSLKLKRHGENTFEVADVSGLNNIPEEISIYGHHVQPGEAGFESISISVGARGPAQLLASSSRHLDRTDEEAVQPATGNAVAHAPEVSGE
jgi:hypothetical protein